MPDSITRDTVIAAPLARVWRAVSDHREFGAWFRARLDQPFTPGARITGNILQPGFEHLPWLAEVTAVEPPAYLAFRWPPFDQAAMQARPDLPWTLVEFRLAEVAGGTRVTVTESGFAALPEPLRGSVLRGNDRGWEIQLGNIADYLAAAGAA
jgi:uncharacterized protein YndB with AHSA1/START domain